jgi:hypothetical protein
MKRLELDGKAAHPGAGPVQRAVWLPSFALIELLVVIAIIEIQPI